MTAAGALAAMAAGTAAAQIEAAPPSIKLGPPSASRFMGKIPANLRPPSADPRDLNGMYVPDIERLFRRGGAPGAVPGGGQPGGDAPAVPPGPPAGLPPGASGPAAAGARSARPALEITAEMLCRPELQVGSQDYGEKIIQTPGRVTIITENNHIARRIYLNARFPVGIKPTFAGHSIGHWEGDTLIIETRGLDAPDLAKKAGLSSIAGMTERMRKIEGGQDIEDIATLHGVDAAGKPAIGTVSSYVRWRPDLHFQEFICEDGADRFFQQ